MPVKAEVILRYGPYSAVGLAVEHRTFRLEGLQAVLAKDGHKVILEKIEEWNVVELVVNEDIVFQCNITDLEFAELRLLLCSPKALSPENVASCINVGRLEELQGIQNLSDSYSEPILICVTSPAVT
ncbi:hypothetical protein H920_04612 [Fukomys damarensis]|uniref:Uncharacterized protein n=1 Tax=Fukomys damarensis TaxID=885580 RepID=A0A091EF06_FUKDA|nr:hypothetical protein H920_04612 [Fukomys damarensis]